MGLAEHLAGWSDPRCDMECTQKPSHINLIRATVVQEEKDAHTTVPSYLFSTNSSHDLRTWTSFRWGPESFIAYS